MNQKTGDYQKERSAVLSTSYVNNAVFRAKGVGGRLGPGDIVDPVAVSQELIFVAPAWKCELCFPGSVPAFLKR
jgi:hypothetical protein